MANLLSGSTYDDPIVIDDISGPEDATPMIEITAPIVSPNQNEAIDLTSNDINSDDDSFLSYVPFEINSSSHQEVSRFDDSSLIVIEDDEPAPPVVQPVQNVPPLLRLVLEPRNLVGITRLFSGYQFVTPATLCAMSDGRNRDIVYGLFHMWKEIRDSGKFGYIHVCLSISQLKGPVCMYTNKNEIKLTYKHYGVEYGKLKYVGKVITAYIVDVIVQRPSL